MYKRNDGLTDDHRLQNQFTAFLNTALSNRRKTYLRGKSRRCNREYVTDEVLLLCTPEGSYIEPAMDYPALYAALYSIKERERHVFLAHVLEEKSFDEIAAEIGLSYKGTAAIYYRSIAKLRKMLGGGENEF